MKSFFLKIIHFFKKLFRSRTQQTTPSEDNVKTFPLNYRNRLVLLQAASQIGVHEKWLGSNPQIEEYLDWGSRKDNKDSGLTDDIPWCAGFVGWCLEKVGMGSTNSLRARSYEKWGVSVKDDPLPGDIVTFFRNGRSSGQGHVGFLVKQVGDYVYILGGNQSDEVNISRYSMDRMTDIRRSSKAGEYSILQIEELFDLQWRLLDGHDLKAGGKVV